MSGPYYTSEEQEKDMLDWDKFFFSLVQTEIYTFDLKRVTPRILNESSY